MTYADFITAFVALFVIIDPIGLAPIFVALTIGLSPQVRRQVALRAVVISAVILIVFALSGQAVLSFLGISLPAFRIAGGLLLFLTALDMLFERRSKRREGQASAHSHPLENDPSVFPLALPLIAGPGAIATIILLVGDNRGDLLHIGFVIAVMLSVLLLVLLLFLLGARLEKFLGPTGINVITRIFGMLLAALSVQFVLDGLTAVWGA